MAKVRPFCREAGRGPAVVCLHSNASHSGQWRALMERLAPRFRVVAVDSWGAGRTPDWPSADVIRLADEVDLIEPVLADAGPHACLVGHSYGAAVALKAALLHPGRFAALVLYEPTLFAVVDRETPPPNDADGIRDAVRRAGERLDAGDGDGAARCFIDFWMGTGSWDAMPPERKPAIVADVAHVRRWAHALTTEPATLHELGTVDMPVLYLTGARSPRSSLAVADLLLPVLPQVQYVDFPQLGHMAPVTHPEPVNAEIERFLLRLAP